MRDYTYPYDAEKAKESIVYLTRSLGFMSKYKLAHLMYLAEKIHLQNFGRAICWDRYTAISEGNICSGVFYLAKEAEKGNDPDFLRASGNIKSVREIKPDRMSQSDIDVLDTVAGIYKNNDWDDVVKTTKDEAWEKTYNLVSDDDTIVYRLNSFIDVVNTLPDGKLILAHLEIS